MIHPTPLRSSNYETLCHRFNGFDCGYDRCRPAAYAAPDFDELRQANLEKSAKFDELRQGNRDKGAIKVDERRRKNLDTDAIVEIPVKGTDFDELRQENLDKDASSLDELRQANREKSAKFDELRQENLDQDAINIGELRRDHRDPD